jgi:hypothetical protein
VRDEARARRDRRARDRGARDGVPDREHDAARRKLAHGREHARHLRRGGDDARARGARVRVPVLGVRERGRAVHDLERAHAVRRGQDELGGVRPALCVLQERALGVPAEQVRLLRRDPRPQET